MKKPIMMIRIPDRMHLLIDGGAGMKWEYTPPVDWVHQWTSGGVLAFFNTEEAQFGVSAGYWDGTPYIHASMTKHDGSMPTYGDMVNLKSAVFGPDRYAAQIMPPASEHVNIHSACLHLWGPLDPEDWPLPAFGAMGTI